MRSPVPGRRSSAATRATSTACAAPRRRPTASSHAAFDHGASEPQAASEHDRKVVAALGEALAGSDRPLVVTSGTGLVRSRSGGPAVETDDHVASSAFPRAASEEAADALIDAGGRVMVMRLPQVHDTRRQGRISWHIAIARRKGRVAYVGEGRNRLAAVHVSDAVRLYRLALEQGQAGARYHAVGEEGVALRDIAEVIGAGLRLPVAAIAPEEAPDYFGWMAQLATLDLAASGALTRRWLGWNPGGPGPADRPAPDGPRRGLTRAPPGGGGGGAAST